MPRWQAECEQSRRDHQPALPRSPAYACDATCPSRSGPVQSPTTAWAQVAEHDPALCPITIRKVCGVEWRSWTGGEPLAQFSTIAVCANGGCCKCLKTGGGEWNRTTALRFTNTRNNLFFTYPIVHHVPILLKTTARTEGDDKYPCVRPLCALELH
jgi:hypothetical protein